MTRRIITQPNILRRATATVVDYALFMFAISAVLAFFGEPTEDGTISASGWPAFGVIVYWILYFPLVESTFGQTLGHKLVGLKVVTENGSIPSLSQTFKRRILDYFELMGFFGLIAVIAVKNSKFNQRVGDLWAKTLVVGGESTNCKFCHQELTLSADDTIAGTFECPECGKANEN